MPSLNTITIQERNKDEAIFDIAISFNNGPEYQLSLKNPNPPKLEELWEWYFERYLEYPFSETVKAERAAQSVKDYGEALFNQIFADHKTFSEYERLKVDGLDKLQIEITGDSHEFQAIHWETLKEPGLPHPFSAESAKIIRKNNQSSLEKVNINPSPRINLLIVTPRPNEERDTGYRVISNTVVELIEKAKLPVNVHILRPGTFQALSAHLDEVGENFYQIIHFDIHNSPATYEEIKAAKEAQRISTRAQKIEPYEGVKSFLYFESNQKGLPVFVEAGRLGSLLKEKQIPVCIIHTCQSVQAFSQMKETSLGSKLMEAGIPAVLEMRYPITATAIEILMTEIYLQLFRGHSLAEAVNKGRKRLYSQKDRKAYYRRNVELEDWLLPVIYQNKPVDFNLGDFNSAVKKAGYFEKKESKHKNVHQTAHGFFGRDLDIMAIEKRLLQHNTLLVKGRSGSGKTALLHHLAAWWEKTGFIKQVFYFGYREKAYTLREILLVIAYELYDLQELAEFQSIEPAAQKEKIAQRLKTERYCLILDDCKSMKTENMLPEEEQKELKGFLHELAGGNSFIIFSSTNKESWLRKVTYRDNIHQLQGLDPEARADLTHAVLTKAGVSLPEHDPEFRRLIALLAGFPLAMEVILPILKDQSPTTMVDSMKACDIDPANQDGNDKTQIILNFVEYFSKSLSPAAKQLLICLAPFHLVINRDSLRQYTEQLQRFETFKDYPFKLWEEVFSAVNYNLIESVYIKSGPLMYKFHPVFSYFVKTRMQQSLNETERVDLDQAFRNHYDKMASSMNKLFGSEDHEEREKALFLTELEYQNIYNAMEVSAKTQQSILHLRLWLSNYIRDRSRGLLLDQMMSMGMESYWEADIAWVNCRDHFKELEKCKGEIVGFGQKVEDILKNFGLQYGRLDGPGWSPFMDERLYQAYSHQDFGRKGEVKRELDEARKNYQKTLEIFNEFDTGQKDAINYLQLGNLALEQKDFEGACKNYEKALATKIMFYAEYILAHTCYWRGFDALKYYEISEAQKCYKKALEIFIKLNAKYEQSQVYHWLGILAQEQHQFDEASKNYRKALEIFIEFNVMHGQSQIYHQLGFLAHLQYQFDEARKNYREALKINMELNARNSQVFTYRQLGLLAQEEEDYYEAYNNYNKALEIYSEFNERYNQVNIHLQLVNIAQKQGEYGEVLKNFQKVSEIYNEIGDSSEAVSILHQFEKMDWKHDEFENTYKKFLKAQENNIKFLSREKQRTAYTQMGMIAQEQGWYTEAYYFYQKALENRIESDSGYGQVCVYNGLGKMAQAQGKFDEARDYFHEALKIKIGHNARYEQASTYYFLGRLSQEQNDYQEARNNYRKACKIFTKYDDRHWKKIVLQSIKSLPEEEPKED